MPGWAQCYTLGGFDVYVLDGFIVTPQMGSMTWMLRPRWAQCFAPGGVFSMSRPGWAWSTLHSLEGPVYVSLAAFIFQRRICCQCNFSRTVSFFYISPHFCSGSASLIKALVISDRLIICSYFIIFRYLLVWFLVLRKL